MAVEIEVAVSNASDPLPPALGAAALSPAGLALVARVLAAHWDPDGAIAAALAARPASNDPTRPRSLADVAREVAGILAAGARAGEASGYLKREELALFGPLPDGPLKERRRRRRERVREALWRAVRGIARREDLEALPEDAAAT